MSTKPQIELFLENENGSQQVTYPFVEADHVSLSNGMDIDTMIRQDVSMPTVTHEDLSFKVGVGDQNVSSAIVDSSVAEMTIKGQTYQNILPEPSTHVLSSNKEMFKVNEGLDPIVEVVDGVSKSAILSGNTLVNLFNGHALFSMPNKVISYDEGVYTYQAKEGYEGAIVPSNLMTLKTPYKLELNKKYTFFITQLSGNPCQFGVQSMDVGNKNSTNQSILESQAHNSRIHKFTFTLTSDYSELRLRLNNYQATEKSIQFKDIMIIEGDYTNVDIPYFEGMQSVKMPVLQTVGANLWSSSAKYTCESSTGQTVTNDIRDIAKFFVGKTIQNGLVFRAKVNKENLTQNTTYNSSYHFGLDICFKCSDGSSVWSDFTTSRLGSLANSNNATMSFFNSKIIGKTITDVTNCSIFMRGLEGKFEMYDIEIYDSTMENIPTSYEPHKTNILTTNEDVELRGIGEVKDELNLLTGEVTERIGKIVLDGSEDENWCMDMSSNNDTRLNMTFKVDLDNIIDYDFATTGMLCDRFIQVTGSSLWANDVQGVGSSNGSGIKIGIPKSNLTTQDVNGFKTWLSQNHVTVQYQLKTPTIKTVDLSSSGNWEKVVLDGSESWQCDANSETGAQVYIPRHQGQKFFNSLKSQDGGGLLHDLKNTNYFKVFSIGNNYGMTVVIDKTNFPINIGTNITLGEVRELWKQWLSQNPITVWYQTETHQDSTQVKQPIFFKDGHIIQSSGADNSLIPTLDYQAKTSNSYVMDLMKTNTKYTMKAKSASGTFTIDGTSYGAGTNGTFTTPTSMTNKLLVMSNKTNTEVMILEGDVTDKTIPYFKGIKSAFEDEGKIEVLSTGKNLFNLNNIIQGNNADKAGWENIVTNDGVISKRLIQDGGRFACAVKVYVKPSTTYTLSFEHYRDGMLTEQTPTYIYHNSGLWGNILAQTNNTNLTFTTKPETEYIVISVNYGSNTPVGETWETKNIQLQENPTVTDYEPHKSNSTKIPLLSPLRSLPNGVCDELIIDRMQKKATLIQRVGEIYATTSYMSASYFSTSSSNNYRNEKSCAFLYNLKDTVLPFNRGETREGAIVCEGLPSYNGNTWNTSIYTCAISGVNSGYDFCFRFPNSETLITLNDSDDMVRKQFNRHLDNKNMKLLYELKTPIITEVDLEGFPYIYKDGHIFLNSEIAPVTEIKYSINQQHQIEASNQDIIRHQKEIDYLYKLIGEYVRVDYKNTLLSLNLELK